MDTLVYTYMWHMHIYVQNDSDKIRISNLNFDEIAVKQVGLLVNGKPWFDQSARSYLFPDKKMQGIRGTCQSTSKK